MGLPIVKSHSKARGYYYDIENDKFFIRNINL